MEKVLDNQIKPYKTYMDFIEQGYANLWRLWKPGEKIAVHIAGEDCYDWENVEVIDNSYDDGFGTVRNITAVCEVCGTHLPDYEEIGNE